MRNGSSFRVSIPNGLHRPFSQRAFRGMFGPSRRFNPERAPQAISPTSSGLISPGLGRFQSRTGSTGHFAGCGSGAAGRAALFQSRTGSTGHLAYEELIQRGKIPFSVSIPNGLHRPFSLNLSWSSEDIGAHVSIPNGLHRPFSHLVVGLGSTRLLHVSIPNGLHRPFSHVTPVIGLVPQGTVSIPNGLHRPFSHR